MSDKCFFDTNILVYAFSNEGEKSEQAEAILWAGGFVSVQVLNEFANVCRNKLRLGWAEIEDRLATVQTLVTDVAPLTVATHEKAVELARNHGFAFYDALIIATALDLGCTHLITEDMQHGRTVGALTIENPFAKDT
jgi:predicted nucleic acid-binding protein